MSRMTENAARTCTSPDRTMPDVPTIPVVPIACILSDCDGVIVDSEVVAEVVMVEEMERAFGVPGLAALMHDMFGRRVIDIIRLVEARIEQPLIDARRAELQRTIDARNAETSPPLPGTLETYRALGLPIAVVSNSAYARLYRSVERGGMLALAGTHVYSAEDVGRPKPAPDAYLHAARELGFAPQACLVIEDSPTGVSAARAAGMRVLGFLGGSHIGTSHPALLREAGATALFDRMRDLPGLIERMNLG